MEEFKSIPIVGWILEHASWVWAFIPPALWVLAVVLRLGLRAFWRWRWRYKQRIEVDYPVVLVHGIFGFDKVGLWGLQQEYFRGIGIYLRSLGVVVYEPPLPMAQSVAVRAQRLSEYIRELPHDRVIIVAHSMGGVGARYAITHLELSHRVASLVTIGTPHHGTPVAQFGEHFAARLMRLGLSRMGVSTDAIGELTVSAMEQFNKDVPNAEGVNYYSVVAAAGWATIFLVPLLWVPYFYLRHVAGKNDGMVPTASQRWAKVLFEVDADHWAQIGWSWRFDAKALYERSLREVAAAHDLGGRAPSSTPH